MNDTARRLLLLCTLLVLSIACAITSPDDIPVEMGPGIERAERLSAMDIIYPKKAYKDRVEGLVIMKGIIGRDGRVKEITILKSLSKECDKEALRVFFNAVFKPARKDGRRIAVYYTITLNFRIRDQEKDGK